MIMVSSDTRKRYAYTIALMCGALSVGGTVVIALGIHIQVSINNRLMLLESYNDGMLPDFLIVVGTMMIIVNVLGIGMALKHPHSLAVLIPALSVFVWIIIAAGLTTFDHISSLTSALHVGLTDAMERYSTNIHIKEAIDYMQMGEQCCGSRSFNDWFGVGWTNTEYVNKSDPMIRGAIQNGKLIVENVPFSCCDASSIRPCVTDAVFDFDSRPNYLTVTLNRVGCTEKLMDEFEYDILDPVATVVMVLFCFHLIVIVLMRLLQTSAADALQKGTDEGKARVLPSFSSVDGVQTANGSKTATQ